MKIACIVLAAGKSGRFGTNKLLKPLQGHCVLSRVLRALPPDRFEKCVCVCSDSEVERLIRSSGIEAVRYAGGALSDSIRTGLSAVPAMDGWLFVNGDQPLLQKDSIIRMVEAFAAEPDAIYRLSFRDVQASPVLFPADMYDALMRLTGEQGGMTAAKRRSARIIPVQADFPEELLDVDDEALFRQAQSFLNDRPFSEKE